MTIVNHPLSPGKGWCDVSLYRAYADLAHENFDAGRYFEAIVVCSVGLDILLNTLPDRLLTHSLSRLDHCQQLLISNIENNPMTGGAILRQLRLANVLNRRLAQALDRLNKQRNKVIHPIEAGKEKEGAITPLSADKKKANDFCRLFYHVLDLAGGRSPRAEVKELRQYIQERRNWKEQRFKYKRP